METGKEFLEGFDPQIKENGYENYSYTPNQVIERLEAYKQEIVKEFDIIHNVVNQRELLLKQQSDWLMVNTNIPVEVILDFEEKFKQ